MSWFKAVKHKPGLRMGPRGFAVFGPEAQGAAELRAKQMNGAKTYSSAIIMVSWDTKSEVTNDPNYYKDQWGIVEVLESEFNELGEIAP